MLYGPVYGMLDGDGLQLMRGLEIWGWEDTLGRCVGIEIIQYADDGEVNIGGRGSASASGSNCSQCDYS